MGRTLTGVLCVSGMLWMLESNLKKDYTRQAQSDSPPAKGEYPKGEGVFPLELTCLRKRALSSPSIFAE